MGIKTKIFAGFTVVSLLLFFSGLIAIYELTSVGNSVQGLLRDNLRSIEVSQKMITASTNINKGVLMVINGAPEGGRLIESGESLFTNSYKLALDNITVAGEEQVVKDIFKLYSSLRARVDSVQKNPQVYGMSWYFDNIAPQEEALKVGIDKLIDLNQKSLYEDAEQMELGTNRAIMPGLIAIAAGIIFIALFNYFVNLYFINPMLRITQGVDNFLKHSIPFRVKIDTKDEIAHLKSSVEKLITQIKSNKLEE